MSLREYQGRCVGEVEEAFVSGNSTLAVMPTGTGKTHCFASLIANWDEADGKILVLAHREELIFQARNKIDLALKDRGILGGVSVEMGQLRTAVEAGLLGDPKCVVASVASLHEKRLSRFDPTEFGLIVVDEAHHAVKTNASYWSVLKYFQKGGCKVLGVTATADRSDEEALGGIFESVAFSYDISEAISDGWLVPIQQEMVNVDGLDFSGISVNHGDLAPGQLNDLLAAEEMCHKVVDPTVDIVGDRKTLVFAAGVSQAQKMAEIFNRHKPGKAICIVGTTDKDERRDLLTRYSHGEFQFLCGCGVFTEGFDEPTIECVVQARPTRSRSLYAQMAGRGTRVLPGVIEGIGTPPDSYETGEEGGVWRIATPEDRRAAIAASNKPGLLIIDFVGNAGRHKLVYAGDLLGGEYSDEVVDLANRTMAETDGPIEVDLALKAARERIDQDRRDALKKIIGKTKYQRRSIDPFDVFDLSTKREPGWHKGRSPTEKMIQFLRRAKVPLIHDLGEWYIGEESKKNERVKLSFWKAKKTIEEIVKRRDDGLCTYAQARVLAKYGERTDVPFQDASDVITEIAQNGWKPRFAGMAEV